jgi:hypothetical protein
VLNIFESGAEASAAFIVHEAEVRFADDLLLFEKVM